MTFNFVDLNADVRQLMLNEIDLDLSDNNLYLSPRLSERGQADYPVLFKEAVEKNDEDWLAAKLKENGRLITREQRRNRKTGSYDMVDVPYTASETLGHGEFNRFYIRAVCLYAIETKIPSVLIYRARPSAEKRPGSATIENTTIDPVALLEDLRVHNSQDWEDPPKLGLAKPNSGLSVRLA